MVQVTPLRRTLVSSP